MSENASVSKKKLIFHSSEIISCRHEKKWRDVTKTIRHGTNINTQKDSLTTSCLIPCFLWVIPSFFIVLFWVGNCITAVPAAILEWLGEKLTDTFPACTSPLTTNKTRALWEILPTTGSPKKCLKRKKKRKKEEKRVNRVKKNER